MGKHVKILENALKKEREKLKAFQNGGVQEQKTDDSDATKDNLKTGLKRK